MGNIFDNLPALVKPNQTSDKLDVYLSTGVEDVSDALAWWHERHAIYPQLAWMATDYLTILGM